MYPELKNNRKQEIKKTGYKADGTKVVATIRHDDRCGNGHNTFSITADVWYPEDIRKREPSCCGCCHNDVAEAIPELEPYLKWHLCSTDGPMHYVANTVYLAGDRDCWGTPGDKVRQLKAARSVAIWPDATDEELSAPPEELEAALMARLPQLMKDFKEAVESLGLEY